MKLCYLLIALVCLSAIGMAQGCPVERLPTELDLYVNQNSEKGITEVSATLSAIDLANKVAAPLPEESIYFQECAAGNITAPNCPSYSHVCDLSGTDVWKCSTGCCIGVAREKTNSDGKASASFQLKEQTTVSAVYPGNDVYTQSNSTGAYLYPPQYGTPSITMCFPLFLIIGLVLFVLGAAVLAYAVFKKKI